MLDVFVFITIFIVFVWTFTSVCLGILCIHDVIEAILHKGFITVKTFFKLFRKLGIFHYVERYSVLKSPALICGLLYVFVCCRMCYNVMVWIISRANFNIFSTVTESTYTCTVLYVLLFQLYR